MKEDENKRKLKKMDRGQISVALDIVDPFLMIDEFQEIEAGKSAKAVKHISKDDWFFQCHLPNSQVMPATLQIEGMLQTLVLLIYSAVDHQAHRSFITDIEVKLLSAVSPKENIVFEAVLNSAKRGIFKGTVTGFCLDQKVCQGAFCYASPNLMVLPKIQ